MSGGYTLGALLVGCACLVAELAHWYPGRKPLMKKPADHASRLVPFLWTWCVGALMVMCVGGLVGWATDWFVWGAGWLGDAAYVWGVGGTRQAAPQGASQPLTEGGLFITVLVMVAAVIRVKKDGDKDAASKKRGLVAGATMGLSAGVASVAAVPLASAMNIAGVWITGAIQ